MRRQQQGFTMIELAISVFILLLILVLAVPSMTGVLADRRLRRSLDEMNKLVRTAQQRSVAERRAYLISWQKDHLILRAESLTKGEDPAPAAVMQLRKGDAYVLNLPAALAKDPPADWVFWPSGTCEPALVSYKGPDGSWTAKYSTLTARAELTTYAAR
jgi:prepilin-type N-terminal cleavage/methylation domain-containing protein